MYLFIYLFFCKGAFRPEGYKSCLLNKCVGLSIPILICYCFLLGQDSDGEKSDQDLVVDDANEVSLGSNCEYSQKTKIRLTAHAP